MGENATIETQEFLICPPLRNTIMKSLRSCWLPLIMNASLNVPMAILTTFANLVVLLAMRHVTSIRLPSKLLLCSLVLTDLGAGLVVQPQFAAFLFMKVNTIPHPTPAQCSLVKSLHFVEWLFATASLLILAAISLDRYAALFFHIKYQQLVTAKRVGVVLALIWCFSLFCASTTIWNAGVLGMALAVTNMAVSLVVISVAYMKIFNRLRCQQVRPQPNNEAQLQNGNTHNIKRYRRMASAMMWVYVFFLLCYVPSLLMAPVVIVHEHSVLYQCIWEFACTLVLLNSCLNPFVYCLRLPEVRNEVIKQIQKLWCYRGPHQ